MLAFAMVTKEAIPVAAEELDFACAIISIFFTDCIAHISIDMGCFIGEKPGALALAKIQFFSRDRYKNKNHLQVIYCFDSDGSCIWTYNTGNVNSGIAIDTARGKVYCAVKDNGICCFSLDGWLIGKYEMKNIETWASIQVDSQTGDVYFGSTDDWLYCLSPPGGGGLFIVSYARFNILSFISFSYLTALHLIRNSPIYLPLVLFF